MTDPFAFVLACLALLAAPGPTNALFAAAGATAGLRASIRLVPAAVAGYWITILALVTIVGPVAGAHPAIATLLKTAASLWLGWSAIALWRGAGRTRPGEAALVTPARLFLTTLINPKTLVFAFVIFPPEGFFALLPYAALFGAIAAATGVAWIALGAWIAGSRPDVATPVRAVRLAAVTIGLFAAWIGIAAIGGAIS